MPVFNAELVRKALKKSKMRGTQSRSKTNNGGRTNSLVRDDSPQAAPNGSPAAAPPAIEAQHTARSGQHDRGTLGRSNRLLSASALTRVVTPATSKMQVHPHLLLVAGSSHSSATVSDRCTRVQHRHTSIGERITSQTRRGVSVQRWHVQHGHSSLVNKRTTFDGAGKLATVAVEVQVGIH